MSRAVRLAWCGTLLAAASYLQIHSNAAKLEQEGAASVTRPTPGASAPSSATPQPAASSRPVLDRYCVTCHNEKLKTAGLMLDQIDVERVGDQAEAWEKVARKLRTQEMPPPGRPRPDQATYGRVATWVETALDEAAAARPNPGRVPVHRLNRNEYTNAIRDLLALDLDGRSLLSADEPDQQGFDNVAGVLSVSPILLENYLSAAATVSRRAIGDPTINPVVDTVKIPTALVQDDRISDDLPFGSRGGIAIRYQFPLDGTYSIKVVLKRQLYLYLIGMGEPHQIDIRLDGTLIKRFTVGGEGKGMTAPESFAGNTQGEPGWEVYMHTADDGLEVHVPVKAGTHQVGVSFVRTYWEPEGVLQPPQRGFARTTNELYFGNPAVDSVSIGGPHSLRIADDTPSRRKVFVCRPTDVASEEPCARKILSTLARRAYRRPVTDEDLQRLLGFFRSGRAEGGFDMGIQRGLRRILAAPSFVFRVEREPTNLPPGTAYRISDLDLASRLSFFLWSSIPDDELLDTATRGNSASRPCWSSRSGACWWIAGRRRWWTTSRASG
jgi:cytochrome c5